MIENMNLGSRRWCVVTLSPALGAGEGFWDGRKGRTKANVLRQKHG